MIKREFCKYDILSLYFTEFKTLYWYCKCDKFSELCYFWLFDLTKRENCETPNKKIDWLWVKNMICKISKIGRFDISQNFLCPTDVELLTSFGRHVFNVLLTLKFFDYFSTSCFQRLTDVDFFVVQRLQPNSTYFQRWYNVVCLLVDNKRTVY